MYGVKSQRLDEEAHEVWPADGIPSEEGVRKKENGWWDGCTYTSLERARGRWREGDRAVIVASTEVCTKSSGRRGITPRRNESPQESYPKKNTFQGMKSLE